jgi:diguanylate cyclase
MVFDTAFVARMLDRLIAGRIKDLETLRAIALTPAMRKRDGIHQQLLTLAHSAHEAYACLQQSREILVGLHRQASGGAIVPSVDTTTAFPNRDAFAAHLSAELKALEPSRTLSIMLIELGSLPLLTDEAGPQVTGTIIKRFATILRRTTKRTDYMARLGREHFAVLFEDILPEKAVGIALRIHQAIETSILRGRSPAAGLMTVTMGIAAATGPGLSATELMEKAQQAIAEARKEGRPAIFIA